MISRGAVGVGRKSTSFISAAKYQTRDSEMRRNRRRQRQSRDNGKTTADFSTAAANAPPSVEMTIQVVLERFLDCRLRSK
jgi:hypothetical protein